MGQRLDNYPGTLANDRRAKSQSQTGCKWVQWEEVGFFFPTWEEGDVSRKSWR